MQKYINVIDIHMQTSTLSQIRQLCSLLVTFEGGVLAIYIYIAKMILQK